MMERKFIKTGVPGLDELLGGGILEGSIITISGPTGSGKSTLAAQFIYNGATQSDEPGLYIAIEESRKDFFFHMSGFSFDFDNLEKERKFIFLDYPMHEVDQIITQPNAIYEIIHSTGVKRVVIDSIMPIALFFHSDDERKKGFLKFIENLRKWNVTIFIISEDLKLSNSGARPLSEYGVESFTDGWINIFYKYDDKSMERKRYLEVIKMKGAAHSSKSLSAQLDDTGFRIIEETKLTPPVVQVPTKSPSTKLLKEEKPQPSIKQDDEDIDALVDKVFSTTPNMANTKKKDEEPKLPPPVKIAEIKLNYSTRAEASQPKSSTEGQKSTGRGSSPGAMRLVGPKIAMQSPKSPPPTKPSAKTVPPKAEAKAPSSKSAKGPAPKPAVVKSDSKKPLPKPVAQTKTSSGSRPPPAKMSQSIADRIAEAKKKIMKKE